MTTDRPNARFIGHAKDNLGFPCMVLESLETGDQLLAYEPETLWERNRYIELMKAQGRDNTPKGVWAGKHPRRR